MGTAHHEALLKVWNHISLLSRYPKLITGNDSDLRGLDSYLSGTYYCLELIYPELRPMMQFWRFAQDRLRRDKILPASKATAGVPELVRLWSKSVDKQARLYFSIHEEFIASCLGRGLVETATSDVSAADAMVRLSREASTDALYCDLAIAGNSLHKHFTIRVYDAPLDPAHGLHEAILAQTRALLERPEKQEG